MTVKEFNGVLIDCCSTCGGSWLDGGELEVICCNHRQGEEVKGELSATALFEIVIQSIPFFSSKMHLNQELEPDPINKFAFGLIASCLSEWL